MASASCSYHIPFMYVSLCMCFHLCSGSLLQELGADRNPAPPLEDPLPSNDNTNTIVVNGSPQAHTPSPTPSPTPTPTPTPSPATTPAPTYTNVSPTPIAPTSGSRESAFRRRGRIVGFVFVSVAGILQGLIALFLVTKRQQMVHYMRRFQDHRDPPHQWPDA
ncbi:hypothetical protein L7F22_036484 [Adiantum nelumboides]|nr:hypothetical protein [Adiantum nelumboides]